MPWDFHETFIGLPTPSDFHESSMRVDSTHKSRGQFSQKSHGSREPCDFNETSMKLGFHETLTRIP